MQAPWKVRIPPPSSETTTARPALQAGREYRGMGRVHDLHVMCVCHL